MTSRPEGRVGKTRADLGLSESSHPRTHTGGLMIRGTKVNPASVMEILTPLMSEERMARIAEVVSNRTRTVVTVVEGAANMGNVNAVMRTAEGLGFFDFHFISADETIKHAPRSSQGAEKWMDITGWNSSGECIGHLKNKGYRIVTTSPDPKAERLEVLDFTQKTALVFGNELDGVSDGAIQMSDVIARVDLAGFVESYNISVAAALCLYHAYRDRVSRQGFQGDLNRDEIEALTATYVMRAVQHGEAIVAEGLRREQ